MKTIEEILANPPKKIDPSPDALIPVKIPCPKCGGLGIIPEYLHNKNGKCFMCNGKKKVYGKVAYKDLSEAQIKKIFG